MTNLLSHAYLPSIEDIVDILQESLALKLRVRQQKHSAVAFNPHPPQDASQVVTPVRQAKALADLYCGQLVVGHVRCQAGEALSAASTHPHLYMRPAT